MKLDEEFDLRNTTFDLMHEWAIYTIEWGTMKADCKVRETSKNRQFHAQKCTPWLGKNVRIKNKHKTNFS